MLENQEVIKKVKIMFWASCTKLLWLFFSAFHQWRSSVSAHEKTWPFSGLEPISRWSHPYKYIHR